MARNYKRIEQDEEYLRGAWQYARRFEVDYDGFFRVSFYPAHKQGVWIVRFLLRAHNIPEKTFTDYLHERTYPTADNITLAGLFLQGCSRTDFLTTAETRVIPKREES